MQHGEKEKRKISDTETGRKNDQGMEIKKMTMNNRREESEKNKKLQESCVASIG